MLLYLVKVGAYLTRRISRVADSIDNTILNAKNSKYLSRPDVVSSDASLTMGQ